MNAIWERKGQTQLLQEYNMWHVLVRANYKLYKINDIENKHISCDLGSNEERKVNYKLSLEFCGLGSTFSPLKAWVSGSANTGAGRKIGCSGLISTDLFLDGFVCCARFLFLVPPYLSSGWFLAHFVCCFYNKNPAVQVVFVIGTSFFTPLHFGQTWVTRVQLFRGGCYQTLNIHMLHIIYTNDMARVFPENFWQRKCQECIFGV